MLIDFLKRRGADRVPGGAAIRSTSSAAARWALLVLRFRRPILAGWLAVLIGGVYLSLLLPGQLVNSFALPGTAAERGEAALAQGFGQRTDGTFTVVFRTRHSSDERVQRRLRARLTSAVRVLPGGRVGMFRADGGIVYAELETSLTLQGASGYTERLRRALRTPAGPAALVTGQPAIQHDLAPALASDLRRGETLALPLALLVLACVLGFSAALAIPLVFAACTIGGALAALYATARLVSVTSYAPNLVELIGLGLAVDYSLLIVCRYREEIEAGAPHEQAIAQTMASAGRTVVISGLAVATGLASLLIVPVPFVRTMGLAGLLVPIVSIVAATTLQPALLSLGGSRTLAGARRPRNARRRARMWPLLARTIARHPVAVLVPTTAVLLAAAAPIFFLRLSPGSLSSLPRSMEAERGLVALTSVSGPGAATPTEVVVDGGASGGALRPNVRAAIAGLVDRLFHDPEVVLVATGRRPPYVSADGRYGRVIAIGRHEYGAPASQRLVGRLRDRYVPAAGFPVGTRVLATGAAPKGVDFLGRVDAFLPWLVLLALAITYVVLARAFRALVLPVEAVLLNLLSVAASCGLVVAVFRFGIGAGLLGVHRSADIEGWVPVFLFATLFGLSMDYEVFLVSRMREAWDARRDNAEAVAFGVERTGRVITAAALVMTVSFAGFVVGSVPGLQQLGLGLAVAVLIDATLVRVLLVPSLMTVLGRWNWWLPRRPRPLPLSSVWKETLGEG